MQRYTRPRSKLLWKGTVRARRAILAGDTAVPTVAELRRRVELRLAQLTQAGPGRVINATGVIIHTNLGRSPWPRKPSKPLRPLPVTATWRWIWTRGSGARATPTWKSSSAASPGPRPPLAVNNNAAAVLLALAAVARGKEGITSRGQLVEIGGSFRVPEVMEQSGVRLVEVGTTNKTYLDDYRRAITAETGVLMRVHPSNYRVVGFQHEVTLVELVALGREYNLPVLDDLGSGTLVDLRPYGIDEPTVQESVEAGADLVCFSGDKMLGGPQCGIVVGAKKWIDRLRKHPLARGLRCDKVTLAALSATLALYVEMGAGKKGSSAGPCSPSPWKPGGAGPGRLAGALAALPLKVEVVAETSPVGGGALPLHQLETEAVKITSARPARELAAALRAGHGCRLWPGVG